MIRALANACLMVGLAAGVSVQAKTLCSSDGVDPHTSRTSVIAAADLGACSGCADPASTQISEKCKVPATSTRLCAAGVVERVSEALIGDLSEGAQPERLSAMMNCLKQAREQLVEGVGAIADNVQWKTREHIALEVSERLIAEAEAEVALVRNEDLRTELENWLDDYLLEHREDLGFDELPEPRKNVCSAMANFPDGWTGLTEKERVDCALKSIAAAQTDLTDTGGDLPDGKGMSPDPRSCLKEDNTIDPACCLVSDLAAPGYYDFPRGEMTFRTAMGEFCKSADTAGLLPPDRVSSDAEVTDIATLLDPNASLNSIETRATALYLADENARHAKWQAAKRIGESRNSDLSKRMRETFEELMNSRLKHYIGNPNAEEFLLGSFKSQDVRPIFEKMLAIAKCYPMPDPCNK